MTRRLSVVDACQEYEVFVLGIVDIELVAVGLRPVRASDDGEAALHPLHKLGSADNGRLAMPIAILDRRERDLSVRPQGVTGDEQCSRSDSQGQATCGAR